MPSWLLILFLFLLLILVRWKMSPTRDQDREQEHERELLSMQALLPAGVGRFKQSFLNDVTEHPKKAGGRKTGCDHH